MPNEEINIVIEENVEQISIEVLDNNENITVVIQESAGASNHSQLNLDDGTNPHGTTKSDVGLGNVPNLDTTDAVNNEHIHSNKSVLDLITEAFTTALKNSYDSVITGYNSLISTGVRLIKSDEITKLSNTSGTNTGDQDLSGLLVKSNNLSDLNNAATARSNLGLGSLATQNGNFADKLDKVTTLGVERVYIINADGTQSTKSVSELLPPFDIIKNYPNQIVISASGAGLTNIGTYAQAITGNATDVLYGGGGLAYRKITSTTTPNSAANIYDGGVFRITGTKAFYYRCRIKNDDSVNISNVKFSYGLSGTAIMGSSNPSSYGQTLLSFGADNTDANCQIIYKLALGSATKINLGASFPKSPTDEYIIEFWRAEGSTTINYKVTNVTTSAVAQGSFVFAFSGLAMGIFRNNDTATTAVAISIRRIELYIND